MENSEQQFTEKRPTRTDTYMLIHITVYLGLLYTMATQAVRIVDDQHIQEEITYPLQSLQNNRYSLKNINQAIRRAQKQNKSVEQNHRHN